jgi:membrane protein
VTLSGKTFHASSIAAGRYRAEGKMAMASAWHLLRTTVEGYVDDNAFSRGASVAYFTLFALAPVMLVVIAVAGLAFGREAAQGAVVAQLSGLMGFETAAALQAMIRSADESLSGVVATVLGVVAILLAVTGVFGEVQTALNAIWKVTPRGPVLSRLVRARLASLGLVVALGFVLVVSLALSAAAGAFGEYLKLWLPAAGLTLQLVDLLLSGLLIAGVFAAIYRILPDRDLGWSDVLPGALFAAVLFQGGKYLIAFYIGATGIASSFGAAGALIVMLLWIFYSAQIFLLGAEFSRAWTHRRNAVAGMVGEAGSSR